MQRSKKRKKRGTRNNYVKKRGNKEIMKQRKKNTKNLMHVLPQCDKCSLSILYCKNAIKTIIPVREYKKEQEKCLISGNFLPKLQKMGIMMARLPRRSGVEISLNIVKGGPLHFFCAP